MSNTQRNPMIKTLVLDAMMAGADRTAEIRQRTQLTTKKVTDALSHMRRTGVVEIVAYDVVPSGARPGHIWKLKGRANG
jgi:DNA-binding HxlR family transcriptional regulator